MAIIRAPKNKGAVAPTGDNSGTPADGLDIDKSPDPGSETNRTAPCPLGTSLVS